MTNSFNSFPIIPATSGLAKPPGGTSAASSATFQTDDQADDALAGLNLASSLGDAQENSQDADSSKTQVDSQGEPLSSDSEVKTQTNPPPEPIATFIETNWPYGLLVLIPIVWFFSALLRKRDPSFKHKKTQVRKNLNPATELKGQFKKSQRFQKKPNQEKKTSAPAAGDSPVDDEFEFDIETETEPADSGQLMQDEESKVNPSSNKIKNNHASSKRFKTQEVDADNGPVPEGEFSINEDEFAFDDQDSQLSLADSDADFGFDIDDEDEEVLFGSDDSAKATEEKVDASPVAATTSNNENDFAAGLHDGGFGFDSPDPKNAEPNGDADENSDSDVFDFDLEAEDLADADIADAQIEAESTGTSGSDFAAENDRLNTMATELAGVVEKTKLDLSAAQKAIEESNRQILQLEKHLAEEAYEKQSIVDQLDGAKQALAEKTVDSNAIIQAERETWQAEKAQLTQANENLSSELETFKQELASHAETIERENENRTAVAQEVEKLKAEVAEAQEKQAELEADRDRLAAELDAEKLAQRDAVLALESKLDVANESRENDQAQIESLTGQVEALKTQLEQAAEAANASTTSDSEIEELRAKFKMRVAQEHRKRKAAQAEVAEAEKQRNELAKALKKLRTEMANQDAK